MPRDQVHVLGLGSNLGCREGWLSFAVRRLADELAVDCTATRLSCIYETAAVGRVNQPAFLNAAVAVVVPQSPQQLLEIAAKVEGEAARTREQRWGPRTLDIDLLWWSGCNYSGPKLTLPHPRLADRAFALVPAAEVCRAVEVAYAGRLRALGSAGRCVGRLAWPVSAPRDSSSQPPGLVAEPLSHGCSNRPHRRIDLLP